MHQKVEYQLAKIEHFELVRRWNGTFPAKLMNLNDKFNEIAANRNSESKFSLKLHSFSRFKSNFNRCNTYPHASHISVIESAVKIEI